MKKNIFGLSLLSLCVLTSCGGNGDKSSTKLKPSEETQRSTPNPQMESDSTINGQYLGVFKTLNPDTTGTIRGAFTFARDRDENIIIGDVRLAGGTPNLVHTQYVRMGSRCPTLEDDKNADGIIDAVEGEAVYGKILIPLDGDITTQASHDGDFPLSDGYGDYIYTKTAPFESFISDLRDRPVRGYDYEKLGTDALEMENKVVVIHGVAEATYLPYTVATVGRYSKAQSLPIACGTMKRVEEVPGTTDDGNYPGTPAPTPEEEDDDWPWIHHL